MCVTSHKCITCMLNLSNIQGSVSSDCQEWLNYFNVPICSLIAIMFCGNIML